MRGWLSSAGCCLVGDVHVVEGASHRVGRAGAGTRGIRARAVVVSCTGVILTAQGEKVDVFSVLLVCVWFVT